jgi:hypothetical protein
MFNNTFFKASIAAKSQNKLPRISKGFQNAMLRQVWYLEWIPTVQAFIV